MKVANQFEQIVVTIHQHGLVASLKKMAGPFLPPIDPAGITEGEILHAARERNGTDLQGKVDVVGHKTKGVKPVAKPTDSFLKQQIKTIAVSVE